MPYTDPKKYAAYQREYHARPSIRAAARLRVKRWRKKNPERFRAQSRRANHGRRALAAGAKQGDLSLVEEYIQILHAGICELCGGGPVEVDHIDALASGGAHVWDNFAGLCKRCNGRKSDRPLLVGLLV